MEQIQMTLETPVETAPLTSQEPEILSVSDVNKAVKTTLESQYRLLWVKGEISNFKAHTSGHFYFSLKDSKAQINAVMFRGFNQGMTFRPKDGMEVIIRGKITVYEPRGNYQIFCELMEPVGAGALQLQFEQLKQKLHAEGLFDPKRKRAIPTLPQHVAVVTSPTGAAIRDILNVLGRRFKGLRVTVVPTVVQGEAAAPKIVAAIQLAQKMTDVDVMIVGRGGGSIEDMWCFNHEAVARAIAASRIPIISAVGHEIDFTIADFVADLRAPTPSAAAELVCRNAAEIVERIALLERNLLRNLRHRFTLLRQKLAHAGKRLVDPKRRLQDLAIRCDEMEQRLTLALERQLERKRSRVELVHGRLPAPMQRRLWRLQGGVAEFAAKLDALSPLKVLDRGYSIVTSGPDVVRSYENLKIGERLNVRFLKGNAEVEVKKLSNEVTNGV
jgi:exodeoxyribonuclease VII large subunit